MLQEGKRDMLVEIGGGKEYGACFTKSWHVKSSDILKGSR